MADIYVYSLKRLSQIVQKQEIAKTRFDGSVFLHKMQLGSSSKKKLEFLDRIQASIIQYHQSTGRSSN
jgi:hypothetical protein